MKIDYKSHFKKVLLANEKSQNLSNEALSETNTEGNLLQPVPAYPANDAKVDDEVLSSAGATASGTLAPTPMETDAGETNDQHSETLGQLIDDPDLLQQLVDQIPDSNVSKGLKKPDGKVFIIFLFC